MISGQARVSSHTLHITFTAQSRQARHCTTSAQHNHRSAKPPANSKSGATPQRGMSQEQRVTTAPGRIGGSSRVCFCSPASPVSSLPALLVPLHPCPGPCNLSSAQQQCWGADTPLPGSVIWRPGSDLWHRSPSTPLAGREQGLRRDFADVSVPPPSSAFCSQASQRTSNPHGC